MATIEQVHREILDLKKLLLRMEKELQAQKAVTFEDDEAGLELADDLVAEIEEARRNKKTVSHVEVMREFLS